MTLSMAAVTYRYAGATRGASRHQPGRRARRRRRLVGPNGAGKSTLCLCAVGLAPGVVGGALTGHSQDRRPRHGQDAQSISLPSTRDPLPGVANADHERRAERLGGDRVRAAESVAAARRGRRAHLERDRCASPQRHRRPRSKRLSGGQAQLVALWRRCSRSGPGTSCSTSQRRNSIRWERGWSAKRSRERPRKLESAC